MEINGSNPNSLENQPSEISNNNSNSREQPCEKDVFVNHAGIAWLEMRRLWVGDQSQKSRRMPREPIMSWRTTYEDLLFSTEPFPQSIP